MLSDLSFADKKTLLVLAENNSNIYMSSRNLKKASVTTADRINTYDVVNADILVFFESSIKKVEELLTSKK